MKGAKCPSHTLKHMRTILDPIIGDVGPVNERLCFLPEPQGADKASKKYVKKYGGLLLVHWAANGDSLAWGQTEVNDLKHPELPYMRYRTDDVDSRDRR